MFAWSVLVTIGFLKIGAFSPTAIDCRVKNTCRDCIASEGCSWCTKVEENFNSGLRTAGCFTKREIRNICQDIHIDDPKSKVTVVEAEPLRGSLHGDPVQIRPQKVHLKIRTGETVTIDVQFRKAEDYPIDLYYLMDFSSSMSKYKRSLSELGDTLTATMRNVTSNFQIGFGSFVDKVTLPYTDIIPSRLERPCTKCRSPYSFKNHMSLSRETRKFSEEVRRAKMSANNDTPEGVLDAIVQAIVCRENLNWREKARHLLVVSTDAPFHLAGDGKLGGIVEPNDGQCHMDKNGYYTHGLILDYPSVSQVHQKALDHNVNIIFAVLHKVKDEYTALSKAIHGASVGLLDRGENIAEIIRSHYERLSTTIHLTDNAKGAVHITYSALCPHHRARADETWYDTNECIGVKSGEIVQFQVHLTALDCLHAAYTRQNITIKPVGINESLIIHLEIICGCECEAPEHLDYERNSTRCSGTGNLICGQCVCPIGKTGERCECNGDLYESRSTNTCLATKEDNQVCSGRGECNCGVCQCAKRVNPNERITGQYCECDNYSCSKVNGLICSGHGICDCGKCSCHPGWSGDICDCPTDEQLCRNESEAQICSGRGSCLCGTCYCQNGTNPGEYRYTGKYCQICMSCGQQCDLYNDCVECLSYGDGELSQTKCDQCTWKFRFLNFTDDAKGMHENLTGSNLCITADKAGCSFRYIYYYNDAEEAIIWAERSKICPKEINVLAIISGTTGGTVLIGLLLLLGWKLLTTIHDKREYEKFERERQLARWGRGENPLYKTAIQSYRNPTYQSDECR